VYVVADRVVHMGRRLAHSVVLHRDENDRGVVRAEYTPDRTIAGWVRLQPRSEGVWYLTEINVADDLRRQGLGSAMIDLAISALKEAGMVDKIVAHLATSEADALWESAARRHIDIEFEELGE
jgi:ribosomal protein S18 acetylase RimI-like enzyme